MMDDVFFCFVIHRHAAGGFTLGEVTLGNKTEEAKAIFMDHAERTQAVSTITEAMASLSARLRDLEQQLQQIERHLAEDEAAPAMPMDQIDPEDGMPRILKQQQQKPKRWLPRMVRGMT